ncbi:hypothetical protein EDD86DRAFT_193895 [Gorgonomyces haynaldii]|nr:hypothetical protein EDD86DRAFT_193895 [Gorgonomyces haynaldii]
MVEQPYNTKKQLIRMSWHPQNLFNLMNKKIDIQKPTLSVFQQRWIAKRELRAYHVPNITQKQFIDLHFDSRVPFKLQSQKDRERTPPYQTLGFAKLERRVDVVVFRSHFANSIFAARQMVVQGKVRVNGKTCRFPARSMEDGDILTVEPDAIPTLEKTEQGYAFKPKDYQSPWMFTPAYLEVDYNTCSTVFLRSPLPQPERTEIPSPFGPRVHQLAFEWYSNIKRRKTKEARKKPLVINGSVVRLKHKFERIMRKQLQQ